MREWQEAAGNDQLSVQLDNPRSDPIPGGQALGCGPLADTDGLAATHEIARQKRLTGDDVTNLIEAHRGTTQSRHISPIGDRFLPPAALKIVIDDVAPVRFTVAGEEILEGAGPQHHELVIAQDFGELIKPDASTFTGRAEMLIEDLLKRAVPFLTAEPFEQA